MHQLSLLAAAVLISVDLKTYTEKRLIWLEKIISLANPDVTFVSEAKSNSQERFAEFWPGILKELNGRLEITYREINSKDHKNPITQKLAGLQYYVKKKLRSSSNGK